ncbi:hypothetical protein ASC89_16650 [Devosia sp. Root413D1]|uniref:DUF3806 domain-containing protein n=1 Tax=Devosia sp. Root413D1 TaxID=1736531 RepID=UPI0007011B28|nr:DUF3806 domain-containing protein [Devosia sp. Root413D1]KQW76851.1 hypothetical protein ASC89_16650 [Devosia sp. Root413D1]
MDQRVEALSESDRADLSKRRDWILDHYKNDPVVSYSGYGAKLTLIDTILRSRWIEPEETWKLQCLGIAFGDALVDHLDLHWVMVEDEYGRDPALQDRATSLKLFPLTMISKRVEEGQDINVVQLFTQICGKVDEVRAKLDK